MAHPGPFRAPFHARTRLVLTALVLALVAQALAVVPALAQVPSRGPAVPVSATSIGLDPPST